MRKRYGKRRTLRGRKTRRTGRRYARKRGMRAPRPGKIGFRL